MYRVVCLIVGLVVSSPNPWSLWAAEIDFWLSASPTDPTADVRDGILEFSLPAGTSSHLYLWARPAAGRKLTLFSLNVTATPHDQPAEPARTSAFDWSDPGSGSPVNLFGISATDGNDPIACGYRFEYGYQPTPATDPQGVPLDQLQGLQAFTLLDLPIGTASGIGSDPCAQFDGQTPLGSPVASIAVSAQGNVGEQGDVYLEIGTNGLVLVNELGIISPEYDESLLVQLGQGDRPLQANRPFGADPQRQTQSVRPEAIITIVSGLVGDLNGDGTVDAADAAILFASWGEPSGIGDLNGDGVIDAADAGLLFEHWTGDSNIGGAGDSIRSAHHADALPTHAVTESTHAVPEPTLLGLICLLGGAYRHTFRSTSP